MTRRETLKALAATVAGGTILSGAEATAPFTLPALDYPFDALEPYIDAQTMQIHHDRHHGAYVNNLNKAIAQSPELGKKSIEELMASLSSVPESIRTAVRNNGGGHINHSLFWKVMKKSGGKPSGELAKALDARFGGLTGFQEHLTKAALGVFGSGWAWLTLDRGKQLAIEATSNQDNPWIYGKTPLLLLDVWEHAYYLKYQNRRADYIAAWFNVVNWDFVSARYREFAS